MTRTPTTTTGKNISVDYDVGGGKEDANGSGGCEDAEDDQAEPVDYLENRGYCQVGGRIG